MDILFTTLLSLHFIVHCILFLSIWLTKIRGDWKSDWEKEEKGRDEWSIWGHLNKCQQILWAQVGISWTSSSSSFWWKLSWHWQELLMRPPSTRNTMSLLKWHQCPASLGLSPSLLTGTGDWALSAVSWCWLLFLMSLPIWKSNTETCLFLFALLAQQSYSPGNVHALTMGRLMYKEVHIQYFTVLSHCIKHLHFPLHTFPSKQRTSKWQNKWEEANLKTGEFPHRSV